MSERKIEVVIMDGAGVQKRFCSTHVNLDCGCGSIDIHHGRPAFCRGFERGVITLDDGGSVTTVHITGGTAALANDTIHVVCEHAAVSLIEDDDKTFSLSPG